VSEGPPSLTNNLDSSTDALAQVERLTTSQTQSWFSEIPPPTAVPRVLKPTSSGAADVDATIALDRGAVYVLLDIDGQRNVRDVARPHGLLRTLRSLGRLREAQLIAFQQVESPSLRPPAVPGRPAPP